VKKIGILYHPMIEDAHTWAQKLFLFLKPKGISIWYGWLKHGRINRDIPLEIAEH
jgi:hypothetical protein